MAIRAIARDTDFSTGHGESCIWPATKLTAELAGEVYANGLRVAVVGDRYAEHKGLPCKIVHKDALRALASGSTTVFANGLSVCRIADPITCGDFASGGCKNVFVGG